MKRNFFFKKKTSDPKTSRLKESATSRSLHSAASCETCAVSCNSQNFVATVASSFTSSYFSVSSRESFSATLSARNSRIFSCCSESLQYSVDFGDFFDSSSSLRNLVVSSEMDFGFILTVVRSFVKLLLQMNRTHLC